MPRSMLALAVLALAPACASTEESVPADANRAEEAQAGFPAQWDPKLGIHVT